MTRTSKTAAEKISRVIRKTFNFVDHDEYPHEKQVKNLMFPEGSWMRTTLAGITASALSSSNRWGLRRASQPGIYIQLGWYHYSYPNYIVYTHIGRGSDGHPISLSRPLNT